MISFEKSIYIDRPPQEVFDYMSDPANDAEWRSGSRVAEWSSEGSVGVGSTMRSEDSFLGRKVDTTSKITSWDPPHQYSFKSVGGSFPAEFSFQLRSEGSGKQLTASGEIEFSGVFKLVEWLFGYQIGKQAVDDFDTLKTILEVD
jgi:carbon monoxide dehydrogenase subunit G